MILKDLLGVSDDDWEFVFGSLVEWVQMMNEYYEDFDGVAPPDFQRLADFFMNYNVALTQEAYDYIIFECLDDPFDPNHHEVLMQLLNVDASVLGPLLEELMMWMMNYMNDSDLPSFEEISEFLGEYGVELNFEAYYFAVFEMDDPFDMYQNAHL